MALFTVLGMSWSFRSRKIVVAHALDLAHDIRPFAVKQLHADLDKGFFLLELPEEIQRLLGIRESRRR